MKQASNVLAALCPHRVWSVGSGCTSRLLLQRSHGPTAHVAANGETPLRPNVPASEPSGTVPAGGVAQHSRAPRPWGAGRRAERAPSPPAPQGDAEAPVQAGEASCGIEANEIFTNLWFCRRWVRQGPAN